MKKQKLNIKTITEFKLWKDNKLAGEYTISVKDAVEKFKQTDFWKTHVEHGTMLERSLLNFISAPESEGGLQSANEVSEWQQVSDAMFKLIYP